VELGRAPASVSWACRLWGRGRRVRPSRGAGGERDVRPEAGRCCAGVSSPVPEGGRLSDRLGMGSIGRRSASVVGLSRRRYERCFGPSRSTSNSLPEIRAVAYGEPVGGAEPRRVWSRRLSGGTGRRRRMPRRRRWFPIPQPFRRGKSGGEHYRRHADVAHRTAARMRPHRPRASDSSDALGILLDPRPTLTWNGSFTSCHVRHRRVLNEPAGFGIVTRESGPLHESPVLCFPCMSSVPTSWLVRRGTTLPAGGRRGQGSALISAEASLHRRGPANRRSCGGGCPVRERRGRYRPQQGPDLWVCGVEDGDRGVGPCRYVLLMVDVAV
jgi:hypothetical protein